MDYKALIKKLRAHHIKTDFGNFRIDLCVKAADALETLVAEREADGWISVEDRLPEDDPNVEKHIEGDRFGFLSVLVYNGVVKQTNRFFCDDSKCGLQKTEGWEWASINVTHWKPLPAPPASRKEDV